MAFNIDTFRAEINSIGVLRPNKFEVFFTPPSTLAGGINTQGNPTQTAANFSTLDNIHQYVHLYCQDAMIPGVQIAVSEQIRRYGYGPLEKKPVSPQFTDAAFIFRVDGRADIIKLFQAWIKLVVNYENTNGVDSTNGIKAGQHPYELSYKSDYMTPVAISTFNDQGEEVLRTVLREAYPIAVGDVKVSWGDRNSYMVLPVLFSYLDWYQETTMPIGQQGNI